MPPTNHPTPPTSSRYPIPRGRTRIEYRVSNSRFIATLGPASTVDEAKAFIRSIREEMPDATHHVYAMRIGHGASVIEGMSDDGEPAGTAGPPALAVVRGSDLGDVVLVITRYFGGTKLGTGGLVAAYSQAARESLAAAPTEIKIARTAFTLAVPYPLYERVRHVLDAREAVVDHEEFGSDVLLTVRIPTDAVAEITRELQGISGGRVVPRPVESG